MSNLTRARPGALARAWLGGSQEPGARDLGAGTPLNSVTEPAMSRNEDDKDEDKSHKA